MNPTNPSKAPNDFSRIVENMLQSAPEGASPEFTKLVQDALNQAMAQAVAQAQETCAERIAEAVADRYEQIALDYLRNEADRFEIACQARHQQALGYQRQRQEHQWRVLQVEFNRDLEELATKLAKWDPVRYAPENLAAAASLPVLPEATLSKRPEGRVVGQIRASFDALVNHAITEFDRMVGEALHIRRR